MDRDIILQKVLPQFFPAPWLKTGDFVYSPFPSCIRIGYVLRDTTAPAYSYVMKPTLTEMQLSLEELHSAALTNLQQLGSAEIKIGKVPGGSEGWIAANEDNFAAARVLLSGAQRMFQEALGDEFLLTIPHRDDCFCWSLKQSPERQEKHATQAAEAFRTEDYCLTPDILRFSGRVFLLHRSQIVSG